VKVATWNVNGIRARFDDVTEWAQREAPDVFCLQEIKATPSQVPEPLTGLPGYHNHYHGGPGGYSGVSLHVRRSRCSKRPAVDIPPFDMEHRAATVLVDGITIASLYVPNGNKSYEDKITFLKGLVAFASELSEAKRPTLLCGDLNVTRSDRDLHETHRKRGAIGQRVEERKLIEAILAEGYVDVGRELAPDDDDLFTWWPPWRQEKAKNRGWRIDYVLASTSLMPRVDGIEVMRDEGSSDHVPVVLTLADERI
jgi:exodeoxyribonuclease III